MLSTLGNDQENPLGEGGGRFVVDMWPDVREYDPADLRSRTQGRATAFQIGDVATGPLPCSRRAG